MKKIVNINQQIVKSLAGLDDDLKLLQYIYEGYKLLEGHPDMVVPNWSKVKRGEKWFLNMLEVCGGMQEKLYEIIGMYEEEKKSRKKAIKPKKKEIK